MYQGKVWRICQTRSASSFLSSSLVCMLHKLGDLQHSLYTVYIFSDISKRTRGNFKIIQYHKRASGLLQKYSANVRLKCCHPLLLYFFFSLDSFLFLFSSDKSHSIRELQTLKIKENRDFLKNFAVGSWNRINPITSLEFTCPSVPIKKTKQKNELSE